MIRETYWSRRRLLTFSPVIKSLPERYAPIASFFTLFLAATVILISMSLVHKNLAPIETSFRSIPILPAGTPFLFESRPHALAVVVSPLGNSSYEVFFENGQKVILPEQRSEFYSLLTHRVDVLLQTAALALSETPGASRVQIWPDKNMSPAMVDQLMGEFTSFGFDDFDFAVAEDRL